jgi:LydA family holin superfamily III
MQEHSGWSWLMTLVYAAFAGFGGSMGYVMRTLDAKERVSAWRIGIEGGAAAFVGVIVMFLCQAMDMSPQWTGVVVGVCGWLGATSSIRMLERVVSRKIGAEGEPNVVPVQHDKPADGGGQVKDPPVD